MATIERETKYYTVSHSVAPHSVVITRTSQVSSGGKGTLTRSGRAGTGDIDVPFSQGDFALVTAKGVSEVKTTREDEKLQLQDLNDRFANYLDRVRNLEAQNRKLADELEKLKAKWGKETSQIKAMYQAELDEARHALDDAEKEKARLEIKVASLEEQIEEIRVKLTLAQQELALYKEKAARQTQQINDYELEIQLLRKQLESLESEHEKDQATIAKLEELLRKAREDLDTETLAHIDAENRRQTLEEAIEFLKSVHDQEMKELAALAYRDTSQESRDFWKTQLAQAIREIEQMYGEKLEGTKLELESSYQLKLQQLHSGTTQATAVSLATKSEVQDLRNAITDLRDKINDLDNKNNQLLREIEALRREKEDRERELEGENALLRDDQGRLRAELDAVMRELHILLGTKMSLDLEIAAYRKLLEGEEHRSSRQSEFTKTQTTTAVDDDFGSSAKGEMSAKTTYSRTAKGAMAISDCPPDGRFVRLENTGKKVESVEGFKVQRNVDGRLQPAFALDGRFNAIQPGQKITIWAKGYKPATAPATDVETNEPTWGIGSQVVTTLINPDGEERASLTQKTVYS